MIVFPNAKINLGLNIVEKRTDGFHNIESVFFPIGLCDVLEVIESSALKVESLKLENNNKITLNSSGIEIPGDAQQNLCCKAYELISKDYPLPNLTAHLHKIIPIGAGLGGGSADAAFFIQLINTKFNLGLSWGELHHYAKQLGSDCSFFISNQPALVKGKGDEFEQIKIDLSNYYLALIYPNIHVNTAFAYSCITPMQPKESIENIIQAPISEWKSNLCNDFETPIFTKHPALQTIKQKLYSLGAVYASMSGSGSSIYGIFSTTTDFKKEFPNYFVWEQTLT